MNLLIDIGHPAHVHYYKNLANRLSEHGHKIYWTTKPVQSAIYLLNTYGFKFKVLPKKRDGLIYKIIFQIFYDIIVLGFCLRKKIDIAIGTSVTVAHISRFTRVKSIVFDDDDDIVQPLVTNYVHPFTDALLSPDCLKGQRKHINTIYYPGYHELAYLHPVYFKADVSILEELNLAKKDIFFILRFNVFKAHHDIGVTGLSLSQKLKIIDFLKPLGKIFITTERDIEPKLQQYQLKINPENIHSLLSYSTMFIGDSQTMASEAAVLGIPSIRCNTFVGRISYLEEEEKRYGLTYGFTPEQFDLLLIKVKVLLGNPNLKSEWKMKRNKMLNDKIDVTSFWVWFIENFPQSKKDYLLNPSLVNKFK
jgi:uncharacterized protein